MQDQQAFPNANHRVGLALIASAGLLSSLSSFSLLAYIAWNVFSAADNLHPVSRGLRTFTISSLAWYLISLLLCDFFQGVAFSLNFIWAAKGMMDQGKICLVQGIVSQIGDLGAAIWSTAISFHTFWLLFLIKQPHRFTVLSVIVVGWTILILLPILGPTVIEQPTRGSFYGLSGAWCWIGEDYDVERVIYLYGWVFGALGCSFIIYTLIYLRFSGFLAFDDAGKLHFNLRRPLSSTLIAPQMPKPSGIHSSSHAPRVPARAPLTTLTCTLNTSGQAGTIANFGCENGSSCSNAPLRRVARRIMWYPVLYAAVVIPVSVCRMGALAGWEPPFGLLVFAGICFGSSGLSNTILFLTTRKSFVTRGNKVAITGVRVTTHRDTMRDASIKGADGVDVELEAIKFSRVQLLSESSCSDELELAGNGILYGSLRSFDGEDRVKV